ncbi:hypothetical protein D299_gp256 [Escherichia phage HX01]|nr:hypothetical protein D299_gp256 [Escherichia phage HX01]
MKMQDLLTLPAQALKGNIGFGYLTTG